MDYLFLLFHLFAGIGVYLLLKQFILPRRTQSPQHLLIPGPPPSSPETGNLSDIESAGSFHQFLCNLHGKYGDIASFWFGPTFCVSICSPELLSENSGEFDKPALFFETFLPLLGEKSLQYQNGVEGKERRREYDRSMSHRSCMNYIPEFEAAAEEACDAIAKDIAAGQATETTTLMHHYSLRSGLHTMFGRFTTDIAQFKECYQVCWGEMEARVSGVLPEPGSERDVKYKNALAGVRQFVMNVVKGRNEDGDDVEDRFIDILMATAQDEEILKADAITYVVGSSHTTANALLWCIYYLATNPEVQERAREEVEQLDSGPITMEMISRLTYLRKVTDETFRCAVLAPIAARASENPTQLGGYDIPAKTPVLHALGVVQQNPEYFPEPEKFDPERFTPEAIKSRPPMAFKPFGFAGKRICPGYRFAYVEVAVCLARLLGRFTWELKEGHEKVEQVYGFITHPSCAVQLRFQECNVA